MTTNFNVISMFSGALGLDMGLERAGFEIKLAIESDRLTRETIKANKPDLPILEDVWNCSTEEILKISKLEKDEIFLICGGPPCQSFSTAGRRAGFSDTRGNVFLKFIDLIENLKPTFILIENVRGLLSAPLVHRTHEKRGMGFPPLTPDEEKGGALMHIIERLSNAGYKVSFTLYDAANYGVPQRRERVILIGYLGNFEIPLIPPTHSQYGNWGLKPWVTLRDVIGDLDSKLGTGLNFPEKRLKYYRMLRSGQYWKNLPLELQKEALGASFFAGGGKTGFLRRLDWDKPAPTLVTDPTMPATDLAHPEEDRPLSIEEYRRIQMFPDNWIFKGDIKNIYRQIGNAVPVGLGEAAGKHIINTYLKLNSGLIPEDDNHAPYSRYKNTDHKNFLQMMTKRSEKKNTQPSLKELINRMASRQISKNTDH